MKTFLQTLTLLMSAPLMAANIPAPALASYQGISSTTGAAFSASGDLYLSDAQNGSLVRYGQDGQRLGVITQSGLAAPAGSVVDAQGKIWVADSTNNRVQSFASDGTPGLSLGAVAGTAALASPTDVAVGPLGRLYVVDSGHNRVAVFDPQNGSFLFSFGHLGYSALDEMAQPMGLDIRGNEVLVADAGNGRVLVFDAQGTALRQIGARGSSAGHFDSPYDVAVDGAGLVWVADNGSQSVQVLNLDGSFVAGFGIGFDGYPFQDLNHLCVRPDGGILVTDGYTNKAYAWAGANRVEAKAAEPVSRSLDGASLLAGPVPARAGQALHVSLPTAVDRVTLQLFAADMRGAGRSESYNAKEAAFGDTAGLAAGVYFLKVTAEQGQERKESLQKVVITR